MLEQETRAAFSIGEGRVDVLLEKSFRVVFFDKTGIRNTDSMWIY